jgi:hypothetical protein
MMTAEEILAQLGPNPTVEELAAHAKGLLGDSIIPIEANTIYEFGVLLHEWNNDTIFNEFHEQLLSSSGTEYIPNRAVECSNYRPLSRSTNYLLTAEEASLVAQDPRVATIDRTLSAKGLNLRPMSTQTSSGWNKSDTVTNSMRNWGLLRSTNRAQISNWGSDGTVSQTATISLPNEGEHVDVVIIDGHIPPNHPEFAVNPDGTGGSRVIQYNWFALDPIVKGTSTSTYDYNLTSANTTTRISIYSNNSHGTNVASIAAGNTNGWARKSNIYNMYAYDESIISSDNMFAYIRAWHANKSINPVTGRKNPTVVNTSFGISYQDFAYTIDTVYYRGTTTTQPTSAPPGQTGLQVTYNGKWTTTQLTNNGVRLYKGYLDAYDVGLAFANGQDGNLMSDVLDAAAEGIIVVGSAGNSWQIENDVIGGLDYNNYYQTQFNFLGTIFNNFFTRYHYRGPIPAASQRGTSSTSTDYEEILCVGNMGATVNQQIAYTSNVGKKTNIFAPGDNIMGATFTGAVTPWYTQPGVTDSRNSSYRLTKMSGTSQASPQVAGIVACLIGIEPHLKMKDAITFIRQLAEVNQMTVPANPAFQDDYQLRGADNLIVNYSTGTFSAYTLSATGSVSNGGTVNLTLTTTNLSNNTLVPYVVTGVNAGDITSGSLSGTFNIQNNTSSTSFVFSNNLTDAGAKTFSISLPNSLASSSIASTSGGGGGGGGGLPPAGATTPGIITRLSSTGILYVNGTFDEVTSSRNAIASGVVYTAELDEITIHPMTNGLAKRETQDGRLLVSGEFDEVTLTNGNP